MDFWRFSIRTLAVSVGVALLAVFVLQSQHHSRAVFHFAVIDEVMTSYGGDPEVQFVEIKMLTSGQRFVKNSVLGAFDASGDYIGDVLVVPENVFSSGVDVRWLMATTQFVAATGLTPDFIIPAGLPTGGGMICWGAPGSTGVPSPGSWDHTVPGQYLDCVAYGSYSGPGNGYIGDVAEFPAPDDADGHSLQRISDTNQSASDFACAETADPTANSSAFASLAATEPCGSPVVGGVVEFLASSPDPPEGSGRTAFDSGALASGVAAGAVAVAAGGWYARRRLLQ